MSEVIRLCLCCVAICYINSFKANFTLLREVTAFWVELGFNNSGVDELFCMKLRAESLMRDGYVDDGQGNAARELRDRVLLAMQRAEKADDIGRTVLLEKTQEALDACNRLVMAEEEIEDYILFGVWRAKEYAHAYDGEALVWQKGLPIFTLAIE
jgi:hypothetical protein